MKNICIVGYGAIGGTHAEALTHVNEACLYGICDILKDRANDGAKKYGCKAFYDYDECISDDSVDSIHICTPHYLHYEMIKKAVDNGKTVVVEKPVVMTETELADLTENYIEAPIYPIVQNRTNECIKELKKIIETDSTLGRLCAVKGILTWCRDEEYYKSAAWRGTLSQEGGGVLINQAVHTLDLMIYLGGAVETVSASMSNKSLKGIIEVEDTVDAYLKYENGAKGIFYATNAYGANSSVQLELEFENASFVYMSGKLYCNGVLVCEDETGFLGKSYWGLGHLRVFSDLYENHKGIGMADINSTMNTMFAIYESAKSNKEISIK